MAALGTACCIVLILVEIIDDVIVHQLIMHVLLSVNMWMLRCMCILRNYTEGQNCMPVHHLCATFSHSYTPSFHLGLSARVQGKKERATGPSASRHKPQLHLPSHRVSRTAAHAFSAFSLSAQFVLSRKANFPTYRGCQSSWHPIWKQHTDHSTGWTRVQPLVRK